MPPTDELSQQARPFSTVRLHVSVDLISNVIYIYLCIKPTC